jgi:hypothetical protein
MEMIERKAKFKDIARREGLTNEDLFVEFMAARFPYEEDDRYIAEWANRFKSGDPASYMDSKSLAIYGNLLKKLRGII